MTSGLSKYLNEQLDVFLKYEKTKMNLAKTLKKKILKKKPFVFNILSNICVIKFFKSSYFLL